MNTRTPILLLVATLTSLSCQQQPPGKDRADTQVPQGSRATPSPIPTSAAQGPIIDWDDRGPMIGSRTTGKDEYSINMFEFGIEQLEDGKVGTFRRQRWILNCSYPEPITRRLQTYCNLERMVIDDWNQASEAPRPSLAFPVVTVHAHNSEDGSLRDLQADWPSGKLDFKVIYTDGDSTDVMIRFRWHGTAMHLTDFKGIGVTHGVVSDHLAAIEYRIPRYSSVLSVPIEVKGFKSSGEKAWNDLVAKLSSADQAAWAAIRTDPKNRPEFESVVAKVQAAFPEWKAINAGEKKLSADDELRLNQAMRDVFVASFSAWLRRSALSGAAQKQMLEHLASHLSIGSDPADLMPR